MKSKNTKEKNKQNKIQTDLQRQRSKGWLQGKGDREGEKGEGYIVNNTMISLRVDRCLLELVGSSQCKV